MRTFFWRLAPWLSRIPLLVFCLFLASLGARWLGNPRAAAATNGVVLDPVATAALTNLRGTGAVFISLAVVVGACLVSTPRVLLGLRVATTIVGCTFVVRLMILALDGATPLLLRILSVEAAFLFVLVCALLLETVRRRREEGAT
jgi:hypothetical protein